MDVLVVDDSLFSRSSVSHALSEQGYTPILCSDGDEAWAKLQGTGTPRLVVCDWVMPGISGLELCRAVRAKLTFPYVYFILLTARNYKVDIGAAVRAGVDDCLTKPCGELELLARVNVGRRLLEHQDEISRQLHHSYLLLGHAPFAIACIDERGTVVDANPAWAKMLGHAFPADLEGRNLSSHFSAAVDFNALLAQVALAEPFHAVRVTLRTSCGQTISPRLWGSPITIDGQSLYHLSSDFSMPR
jgi:PAS domain S-box-containing protein